MLKAVDTGLPSSGSPVSNAIVVDRHLYTVQVPRHAASGAPDNSGNIGDQTHRVLRQLKNVLNAAGGSMADVAQVTVYLIDEEDAAGMNEVYREYFSEPFPNRATVVANALMGKGRRIEIVVHAHPGASADKH